MKTIKIITLFMLMYVGLSAQNEKFTKVMLTNLEKAKTAKEVAEFQDLANSFERIAMAEKSEWTAWYYASYYNFLAGVTETENDKKMQFIEKARKMIDEGLKVKKDETELMVIKVLSYYIEMSIDQMKAMELMPLASGLLEQAKAINPENPRIYLTQAQAVFNTPPAFGGGKEKALPIILLAKEKFDAFIPENQLVPNWGKENCEEILTGCQSEN